MAACPVPSFHPANGHYRFRLFRSKLHLSDDYRVFIVVCTLVTILTCTFLLIGAFLHLGTLVDVLKCTIVLDGTS